MYLIFFQILTNESSPKIFNTHVMLDDQGQIRSMHDKMHLFEANIKNGDQTTTLKESDYTIAGSEFYLPVQTPVGIIGSCIVKENLFFSS
jgi:predicted amidohydrolase